MEESSATTDDRTQRGKLDHFEEPVTLDDHDWSTDPKNPHLWSKRRKFATVLLVSSIGFVCTMGSSIYAPGREQVAAEFRVSDEASILPVSLYNVGMGLGPLIASPLSETFGRRFVYLIVLPLFSLFVLGSGFASDLTSLTVCRFFAGVFASPSVAIAAATIADMHEPASRALPLIVYYTTPTLGALSGPLIGGFVVSRHSWHWTAWTTLFFAIPVFLPILFTRESYKKALLASSPPQLTRLNSTASSIPRPSLATTKVFITQHLGRPLHMLLTEPIVSFLCLYMSFQFGLLYCFVIASPTIFHTVYAFTLPQQGLSFLGLITGCILASLFLVQLETRLYRPRRLLAASTATTTPPHPAQPHQQQQPPESRLHAAMIGSLALPLGLFAFAFLARPDIHWLAPIAAQGLVMFGSLTIYIPSGMYLMETYGARYGASASGANSLLRYALASSFPLFSSRMYEGLGVRGATCLLGGCTVVMGGIPWVLRRWGATLRGRSGYVVDE